ncbi:5'/3'-nucleotidase SurE [Chlamydiifrater phoenicopteri]|uniref:5'/3'-nucleotidase SurE n=1 Tax=Chlamydiifrater phoenicopteri TaxID=2681469 RepID=UPI001BCB152D|nr:5'/3'-nucleotidase SurE [Chlamydiifrater phoenicopteri]
MTKRLKIVLTNDDGISATGMSTLVELLNAEDFADIYIVAPLFDQSGMSMSFSYRTPIAVESVDYKAHPVCGAWAVEGTPVDCIKIALSVLFKDDLPDLVISGINHGGNGGKNTYYSGTVGAAMEAVFKGIPSLALSQEKHISFFQKELGRKYIRLLAEYASSMPFTVPCGYNVTFPYVEKGTSWQGMVLTHSGNEFCIESPIDMGTIQNRTFYSLKSVRMQVFDKPSQEFDFLMSGKVAVSPIGIASLFGAVTEEQFSVMQEDFKTLVRGSVSVG